MRLLKKINFFVSSVLVLLTAVSPVYCLPQDEQVVSGSAQFDRSTQDTLTVNTPSDKLIVEYSNFNIAQAETVNFNQPSSSSVALNRVIGFDPSAIAGALKANGQVFVVNPNGIMFGPNSRVDVAGLVASTLDISNEDFLAGKYNFFKNGENAYIINQGNISIRNGGYACLLSAGIDNQGTIQANLGTAVLASGEAITLALDDLSDISVVVDEGVKTEVFGPNNEKILNAIKNSGTISANGGKVILTAKALNKVFDYAINNTGIIEADNVINHDGVVELVAGDGHITSLGTLRAKTLVEKGASFLVGGICEVVYAYVSNLDNAINWGSGDYKGSWKDDGDININAGATVNVTGNLTFWADHNTNGRGVFNMGTGSSIVGNSHNLTIKTSSVSSDTWNHRDSNLRSITGVATLTLEESDSGSDPDFVLNNNISVGNLTLNDGTLYAGSSNISVSGDWTKAGGDFNAGTSTVSFNDASNASTISGSTTFNDFSVVAGKTIYFASGTTQTIKGILTMNGTPGNIITLARSGGHTGDHWNLKVTTGSPTVSYVSVSNSNASGGKAITANNSTNGGNNHNWTFVAPITLIVGSVTLTYGDTATLTATLSSGSGLAGKTINFTLNGTPVVPTAITNSSGVATLTNVSFAGINAGTYAAGIGASFAGDATYGPASGTAQLTINQKALTVTANSTSKTYGQTYTFDTITPSDDFTVTGLVNGNTVTSVTLASAGAAAGATVTTPGPTYAITASGALGTGLGNYTIGYVPGTLTVDQRALIVSATGINKVYDGNAIATATLSDDRLSGDSLTTSYTTATFDNKNIGKNKPVSVSGISISGTDAGNYTFNIQASTIANIDPGAFYQLPVLQEQFNYEIPDLPQLLPHQINTFDLMSSSGFAGPMYAYHPLTETDMSAFDGLNMEEGAYEFINGGINIRGHNGLQAMLMEIKKNKQL